METHWNGILGTSSLEGGWECVITHTPPTEATGASQPLLMGGLSQCPFVRRGYTHPASDRREEPPPPSLGRLVPGSGVWQVPITLEGHHLLTWNRLQVPPDLIWGLKISSLASIPTGNTTVRLDCHIPPLLFGFLEALGILDESDLNQQGSSYVSTLNINKKASICFVYCLNKTQLQK